VSGQGHVGQFVGEYVEHHLQLQPGEVRPDAVVGATGPEGDVGVRRPSDVEAQWFVEDLLVEVGRGEVEGHPLTSRHRVAADLGVHEGGALESDSRRGPAQDLVDGRGRAFVPPPLPLVRMLQEGQHAVGRGLSGRLVAGHREDHEEEGVLLTRQLLPVGVGLHEAAGDVTEIVVEPLLGGGVGVQEHLHDAGGVRGGVLRVLAPGHLVAPVEELLVVGVGDTHEAGDGLQGEVAGDVDDEVPRPGPSGLPHDPVGALPQVVLEAGECPRRETPVPHPADPRVPRRVHAQQQVLRALTARIGGVEATDERRVRLDRPPLAPGDRRHVLVAGDGPESAVAVVGVVGRLRIPPHRVVPAEPGELVERQPVGQQVGVTQIQVGVDGRRGHRVELLVCQQAVFANRR